MPIMKPDNSIRIFGDYKTTVNQVSELDNYPIQKAEDLLATRWWREVYEIRYEPSLPTVTTGSRV